VFVLSRYRYFAEQFYRQAVCENAQQCLQIVTLTFESEIQRSARELAGT
jgi:hypothetical protein